MLVQRVWDVELMASGLILLAEDNIKLRKLYSDVLQAQGFTVVSTCDGLEALNFLDKGNVPKLVIFDIEMPGMDGIETCRNARRILGSRVPILFLTASDRLSVLEDCMQAGGDDFLIKSDSIGNIVERVKFWMEHASLGMLDNRRRRVTADVAAFARNVKSEETPATEPSAKTDDTVRVMALIAKRAHTSALEEFDSPADEKLYVVGYVAGIIDCWVDMNLTSKPKFLGYLRIVLEETLILTSAEISQMVKDYEKFAAQKIFRIAWERAREECAKIACEDDDHDAGLNAAINHV